MAAPLPPLVPPRSGGTIPEPPGRLAGLEKTASLHAFVRGDVQGVGFRYFVQRRAREMGLAGWVRNCPDGSVELVAEGDRAALGRLLELAGKGPGLADVDRVDVEWGEATGLKRFDVRV